MARNRDKRPGTASGSASRSQNPGDKTGDASAKDQPPEGGRPASTAASSAIAAKLAPQTGGSTKPEADKPSPDRSDRPAKPAAASSAASSMATEAKTASSNAKTGAPAAGRAAPAGNAGGPSGRAPADGGFWPGLVGGVIGGAATALAASLFWVGADDDAATAALESRLAAIEQQAGQVTDLGERLAAIETAPADASEQDEGLAQRLDDLEARLASLGEAPAEGADEELGERLASLEQRVDEQIVELDAKLQAASEAQQASIATLNSVESALPGLEATLAATGKTVDESGARTTALSESVDALSGDVQTLASRVGEAEGRLDHLGGEYQRGAAMIVAIGDVDRAVTRGGPFDSALQSLKSLVRDETVLGGTVATLEPMAAEGVPTTEALKSTFGEMASRVLLAEKGDRTLADQLGDNVFGILNMRPSGSEAEGSDSRAILARAQARLGDDDLDGAIGELAGLEGVAAEEAGGWIEHAQARLSAEAAVVDLRAHAQTLVAKGT